MEQHRVTGTDGTRFAVQVGGPAQAPPLLLLSGQANSGRWWDNIRGDFGCDFRTVSFDYRGSGDTETDLADWKNWSASLFAIDAADVMAALGFERFHVYGTSMGGRVAQHLAADRPELVDRLILGCTSPGGPASVAPDEEVTALLASPSSPERTAAVLRWFFTPAWKGSVTGTAILGDPRLTREGQRGHRRVSNRHDAWDKLPDIAAPTLVIHGADDPMVPAANATVLAERIPGARLCIHETGRHGFFEEFAAEIAPALQAFLQGDDSIGDAPRLDP